MPLGEVIHNEQGEPTGFTCSECAYVHPFETHAQECCPQYECSFCGNLYAYDYQAEDCHPEYECDNCGDITRDYNHECEYDDDVPHDDYGNPIEVNYPPEIRDIVPTTQLYVPSLPLRPARYCSIEQELCSGATIVARMLADLGVSQYNTVANYSRDADPRWILIKQDSSLPEKGGEVVYSRFNLSNTAEVKRLSKTVACIRALREGNLVTTTTAAGTHIHISALDEDGGNVFGPAQMASLYEIFSFTEEVLFQLATAGWQYHRDQGGEYARALTKFDKVSAGKVARSFQHHDHRYFSLNFLRLLNAARNCSCGACVSGDWDDCECGSLRMGTIEWRVFNATTKPETLHAWVLLSHGLTAAAFGHQLGTLQPNAWQHTAPEKHAWIFSWILQNCPFLDEERQIIVNCARRVPSLQIDWDDFARNDPAWGDLELPDLEEEGEHLLNIGLAIETSRENRGITQSRLLPPLPTSRLRACLLLRRVAGRSHLLSGRPSTWPRPRRSLRTKGTQTKCSNERSFMLQPNHVKALNSARSLIADCERKASAEHGYQYGKFAEACKTADAAIFNVLVIARAWLGAEISTEDLYPEEEETLVLN